MNIVDKLLKADAAAAAERATGAYASKRLARIVGEEEPIEVEIRALTKRRLNDLLALQMDSHGEVDIAQVYDSALQIAVEGMTSPSMKDKELQEHYGVKTAKDLAEKLFDAEIETIAEEIVNLTGVKDDKKTEDAVKN